MSHVTDKLSIAALKAVDTVQHAIRAAIGGEEARADGDRSTIRVRYDLAAPPEKVWQALTEPAILARWLFPNDFNPERGRHFTFQTTRAPGFDGVIRCEVLNVEPHHRLVYTWKSSPADTVVDWTLERAGADGSRLLLVHSGFRPEDGWIYEMLKKGWSVRSGDLLKQLVASL